MTMLNSLALADFRSGDHPSRKELGCFSFSLNPQLDIPQTHPAGTHPIARKRRSLPLRGIPAVYVSLCRI